MKTKILIILITISITVNGQNISETVIKGDSNSIENIQSGSDTLNKSSIKIDGKKNKFKNDQKNGNSFEKDKNWGFVTIISVILGIVASIYTVFSYYKKNNRK